MPRLQIYPSLQIFSNLTKRCERSYLLPHCLVSNFGLQRNPSDISKVIADTSGSRF